MATPFVALNLPTVAAFANGRRFAWPRRSIHVLFTRAHAERITSSSASPRPPQPKRAMAIPARIPEEPGDGRLDHSVEQSADRKDARAGRLDQHQTVRRIWPGCRDLHAPDS